MKGTEENARYLTIDKFKKIQLWGINLAILEKKKPVEKTLDICYGVYASIFSRKRILSIHPRERKCCTKLLKVERFAHHSF